MSGHSKWHSIKHKKGAADAKRGKLFSKLARAVTVAARLLPTWCWLWLFVCVTIATS